jgi:4'-phosphopantetheinyl transferase
MMLSKLTNDEVHVYYYNIRNSGIKSSDLLQHLVSSEKLRAERFRFNNDMFKYITGRALLRQILGSYLDMHPCEIEIQYNNYGKPLLGGIHNPDSIEFNLSHSSELIVYTLCRGMLIGVDTEFMNASMDHINTARQFCTPSEFSYLRGAVDHKDLVNKFFRIWTRKEAVLKGNGRGISPELKKIDVLENRIVDFDNPQNDWNITDLNINENYKTAVAVSGKTDKIIINSLPDEFISGLKK